MQLFGGLRIVGPGAEIDRFPTRRAALLLARVALSRSGAVGRDELAEALWPDDYLDATRLRLRQELNRLRQGLGPAAEIISSDRSWVRLDLSRATVDAREFNRLSESSKGQPDARSRLLALYAGPLLPEQSEDWVQAERQDYHARYLALLNEQTEALLALDRHEDALASALRAVRADPYHEPARMAAMRAFAGLGDLGGAIRQYVEYEKAVAREFSAVPSEAMQNLLHEIRTKRETASESRVERRAEPTQQRPTSHLPAYLDRIVGREKERMMLTQWLAGKTPTRLVTITGAGGVGKTRVAAEGAKEVLTHFEGNVVFVDLTESSPGQPILEKIREAAGSSTVYSKSEPLPGLGSRKCLFVIDNAEHVIAETRAAVKEILLAHSGSCVLVTSRQRLGLGGEQELPLAPLNIPDLASGAASINESPAAELFLERAVAVRPGFTVAESDFEAFAMLLDRLDGLPLAIELAAARIGFLGIEQMLGEIDDRFTFLVNRRADVGTRQRSLRATIDWSFRGLQPDLGAALELCSVFRGGWSVELARQASGRADIIDQLQDLLERSLIFQEQGGSVTRFGMLESIREYVFGGMETERREEVRRKHGEVIAESVFAYSRKFTTDEQNHFYEAVRLELPNARAAIDWAIECDRGIAVKLGAALWRFWCAWGSPKEGADQLDRILSERPDEFSPHWGEACLGRGALALLLGDRDSAREWDYRAVETFEEMDRPGAVSWALNNLASAEFRSGRIADAYATAQRAMQDVNTFNRPLVKTTFAMCEARMGRYDDAMSTAEEAFAASVGASVAESGRAFLALADSYVDCGRYDGVHGLLLESIDRLRRAHVQDYLLNALLSLADELWRLGDKSGYEATKAEAAKIAEPLDEPTSKLVLAGLTARELADHGRTLEAIRCCDTALRASNERGDVLAVVNMVRELARYAALSGFPDHARSVLAMEAAFRLSTGCGLTKPEAQALDLLREILGDIAPVAPVTFTELVQQVLLLSAQIR